jgi:pumilio family protein 6
MVLIPIVTHFVFCLLTSKFTKNLLNHAPQSLKKQMTKLAVHSVASRVIELLFATFPSKFTSPLKLELYGPQYALFANTLPTTTTTTVVDNKTMNTAAMTQQLLLPTLEEFVQNHPNKREPTLSHIQSLIQKGLDKSLVGFAYFHTLLHDYITIASSNEIRSYLTPSVADHALHLLSTRHGTRVVCECLAYGTVKDRKRIIKCMKGYTRSSLLHRDAYLAILRVCDVMDDTVLVNKMLFAELHQNPPVDDDKKKKGIMVIGGSETNDNDDDETKKREEEVVETSPILDLVLSDTGSKLFLLLLVSKEEEVSTEHHLVSKEGGKDDKATTMTDTALRWQKYFDPYELSILHRNPTITEKGEDGPVPTSKKADEIRRQELVAYLNELLLGVCTSHAKEMLRSKTGSRVLLEVCESYRSVEVNNAIVEACCCETDDDSLSMFEDPVGHLTLKNIFLSESKNNTDSDEDDEDDNDEPTLARAFYSKFQTRLGELACSNRGAFVLAALMSTCVGKEVRVALMDHKKDIAKLAIGGGKEKNKKLAGCGVLLELLKKK